MFLAPEEVVNNIKQVDVLLPVRDRDNDNDMEGDMFEYLGKKFGLVPTSQ